MPLISKLRFHFVIFLLARLQLHGSKRPSGWLPSYNNGTFTTINVPGF